MLRYRTEINVPADRYVCLQLPATWPEGPALVLVVAADPEDAQDARSGDEFGLDRDDIEWWEEFDDEPQEP